MIAPFDAAVAALPDRVAAWRAAGGVVVGFVGADVPVELLRAAGLLPLRLTADRDAPTELADALLGAGALDLPRQALLHRLLAGEDVGDRLLLSHDTDDSARLFAIARELRFRGELEIEVAFVDLLRLPQATTVAYNRRRLGALRELLEGWAGRRTTDAAVVAEIAAAEAGRAALRELARLRAARPARLSGADALRIVAAGPALAPAEHAVLVEALLDAADGLPARDGLRVLVTGSELAGPATIAAVEAAGAVVVADDLGWGDRWFAYQLARHAAPLDALAERHLAAPPPVARSSPYDRARFVVDHARARGAEAVVCALHPGDDAAPWDVGPLADALAAEALPLLVVDTGDLAFRLAPFLADPRTEADRAPRVRDLRPASAPPPVRTGERSRKALRSVADFGRHQRAWFAAVRERAAAGEPFAVVNADAPQELLRAFDVPFVVNQWWSSLVAAKQRTPDYLDALRAHRFPDRLEPYSTQGIAALWDGDDAPWGGLPRPTLLEAIVGGNANRKLFERWAAESGATLLAFERSIESRLELPDAWWDVLPQRWDTALEPERLDLLQAELERTIDVLEDRTGRRFDAERFASVMDLVNEQEEAYRRTRDLIARTRPAPVGIADTMPATMVPQWHRGTEWGRAAALRFEEEVAERAAAGEAACPGERVRLMWLGRGVWSDMGLYQRFEAEHGAVFVWSIYLGLAADGYLRYFDGGRDPLRALASRFVTVGDELRMPTWAGAWHVREARSHGVDGAVAAAGSDPFVVRALEEAGVPVLDLGIDNVDSRGWAEADVDRRIAAFLRERVAT